MKRIIYTLIVLFIGLSSCEEVLTDSEVLTTMFKNGWTHSREEQEDISSDVMIFRPSDSREFPASWFRDAYEFNKDGSCRYMYLHPADGHHMKDGTYTYDPDKNTIRIFSADDVFLKEFKIIQLMGDLLMMELTERG